MKKKQILHTIMISIWISMICFLMIFPSQAQTPPSCATLRLDPIGNCCWKIMIQGSNNTNIEHRFIKMVFSSGIISYTTAFGRNTLPGWDKDDNATHHQILQLENNPVASIPWGWYRIGTVCLTPPMTSPVTVSISFSDDTGSNWIGSQTLTLLPVDCPLPCPPINITSQSLTCGDYRATPPGYVWRYYFSFSVNTGTTAGTVTSVSASLGNAYIATMNPSNGATQSPGTVVNGNLDIISPYSPQPTGNVTFTITVTLPDGTLCSKQVTLPIPPCQPDCSLDAIDTSMTCVSSSGGLNTYQFELILHTGCSSSWPNAFMVSLMNIQLANPATGTVTLTNAGQNLAGSTMVFQSSPPYFSVHHCSPSFVEIYGTLVTAMNAPSLVSFVMTFDITDNSGTTVYQCEATTPPYPLPSCPCQGIVDADPDIVCEPGGSSLTLTGYTGSDNCVEWFRSETDPMGVNATDAAGNLNTGWQGPVGQGIVYNTTNLTCNPPNTVDHYWYQAVISDQGCMCHPLWSQILNLEVDPVLSVMGITGSYFICDGDLAELSIYNNQTGQIGSFGCPVEWWDLNGFSATLLNPGNPGLTTIQLGALSSPTCPPSYTTYGYRAKICGECNERQWSIYVSSKPVPTNIIADRYLLCWGEATVLHVVDDTYCGSIQWEQSEDMGNTWQAVPNAIGTKNWNTDRLIQTTMYRVRFANGPCPVSYSNEITVVVQQKTEASISYYGGSCPGIICGDIAFQLTINPNNVPWEWHLNGVAIPGTGGVINYFTSVPGNYSVYVSDPVCGDVTSNILPAEPLLALLYAPDCICFTLPKTVVDFLIVPNCTWPQTTFLVWFEKNGVLSYLGPQFTTTGEILLTGYTVLPGDLIRFKIQGDCGEVWTNFWEAHGCVCY